MYKKGDWSFWRLTDKNLAELGYGKETFVRFTLRQKVRILIGFSGNLNEHYYLFKLPSSFVGPVNLLVNLIPAI